MGCVHSSSAVREAVEHAHRGSDGDPPPPATTSKIGAIIGLDKYPRAVRVAFAYEERGLLVDSGAVQGQELGLRYAEVCRELGTKLGLDPAALAEAYTDPRIIDAGGNEVSSVEDLEASKWPITFEFPQLRRRYNLLLGQHGAGKTALLNALRRCSGGQLEEVVLARDAAIETLALDDFTCFASWALPRHGRDESQAALAKYLEDAISLIFVVDSSQRARTEAARASLEQLLGEGSGLRNRPLLVYANKSDVQGALPAAEVAASMKLESLPCSKCNVQACCALTGEGVFQGIDWLSRALTSAVPAAPGAGESEQRGPEASTMAAVAAAV